MDTYETVARRRLRSAAGTQATNPDLGAIARRARRLRRQRALLAAAAVVPVLGVLAFGLGRPAQVVLAPAPEQSADDAVRLPVPASGDAAAVWVDDVPVLVVNAGGSVYAVEAISPHRDLDIGDAVAWCRPAQAFVSVQGGDRFGPDGSYQGGPAPTGLATFATEATDDGSVTIGPRRDPRPRSGAGSTFPDGSTEPCHGVDPDPDAVVQHDWPPEPGGVLTPQEAAAQGQADRLLVSGRLLVRPDEARLCAESDEPSACPSDGLVVDGVAPLPAELALVGYAGLWRVDVAGGVATRITHVRTEMDVVESADAGDGSEQPPDFAPADRVVVDGSVLQVPAVDLDFGRPPEQALTAGTYELRLDNHGGLVHTLAADDVDVALAAEPGRRSSASVSLTPGEYTFYCRLPGHREAGMEVRVVVDGPSPAP